MAKSTLQLNFPDSSNAGVLLIDDISIYDSVAFGVPTTQTGSTSPCNAIQIPCGNLQITPPGYSTPTIYTLTYSGFRLVLNAFLLGLTNDNEGCPNLPDGLYNIRYSIAPNTQVFVEYKMLRTVRALNRYYDMLCKIDLQPCLPDDDIQAQLSDLDVIHNYLKSAKATVENLHLFSEGMNQYRYAVELMDKMSFEPRNCRR